MTVQELETPRLRLRAWRDADLEPFAALNADPRVMEFFPASMTRAESDAMADKIRSLMSERGWGFWAVEIKEGASFAGFVGLHIPNVPLPFSPCVEVGWRLAAAHWSKGYATEAARAALGFGFGTLGLEEIVSFTAERNNRSRQVMEKLGLRNHGEDFVHPTVPVGHPMRPHVLYRLRREEWDYKFQPIATSSAKPSPAPPA